MRTLKLLALVAICGALLSNAPQLKTWWKHLSASASTVTRQDGAYQNICGMTSAYLQLTGSARKVQADSTVAIAKQAQAATNDPELRAFLSVVPQAVGRGSAAQTRTAQALLNRECKAHNSDIPAGH